MARRNSPFAWFRKHQKVALVSLGVMAMLSFIVVPSLMQLIPQIGAYAPKDLASCREFGAINDVSLSILRQNRQSLRTFFSSLCRHLASTNEENNKLLHPLFAVTDQLSSYFSDEDLINEWLLVKYAQRKLRLTISDQEISEYLRQLTNGLASDAANAGAMYDAGMNAAMLKARLREYLLFVKVDKMFSFHDGFMFNQDPISPLTRWDWFQRIRRSVTAEVAAVPVELFMTKVSDPSAQELQKFFDDNKARLFRPGTPESGFMHPDKIAFQYIKIVPDKTMLDSISMEEIEKFYEENKVKLFRKPVTPIGPPPGGQTLPGAIPFPTLFNTTPLIRSDDNVEIADDDASEEKNDEMSEPEETPVDTPVSEEKPAEEDQAEDVGETSLLRATPMTRPVSFLDETPMEEAKAEENTSSETTDSPVILEVPTTTPELPTLDPTTTIPLGPESEIDLAILFIPFEEVEDEIRRILVQQPLDDAVGAINEKMREYSRAYYTKDTQQHLDLRVLAGQYGFEFVEVPLVAFHETLRLDFVRGIKERQFLARLFSSAPVLFDPQTIDGDSVQYLFWTTDYQSQKEPQNLEEVRATVLNRWKEIQARPLAVKRAEELMKQAKESGGTLANAFKNLGDVQVVETESFTWDSIYAIFYMERGVPPPLGEVREKGVADGDAEINNTLIVAPGERFMEVAYGLAVNEVGVAMNQSETVAYIIRVTESSPPIEELRQSFQSMKFNPYLYVGKQAEMIREARNARLKRIQDEVGFKWINKPERQ